jgi:GNAT superfamily N-acetyltransferase
MRKSSAEREDPQVTTHSLDNPIWHALNTEHAHLALGNGRALRYPTDVVPVAGLAENTSAALVELRELLAQDELIWVAAESLPSTAGMELLAPLPCLQMIYGRKAVELGDAGEPRIKQLSAADAPAMVALTDAAFPGFFRPRTYLMGDYFGIFNEEQTQLIAMAGNRLAIPGARELSAVVTLPGHTGQGHAARLITRVLAEHAGAGLGTFLHVAATNHRAIALYERLGFATRRVLTLQHIRRVLVCRDKIAQTRL